MNIALRPALTEDFEIIAQYWTQLSKEECLSMGVDDKLIPCTEDFLKRLNIQNQLPLTEKKAYALVIEMDGTPIGHTNVNPVKYGDNAFMHLHIWDPQNRSKGYGAKMLELAIPEFLQTFELKSLYCSPMADNPAPNKSLKKAGFKFIRKERKIPGNINFMQEVNIWEYTP